LNNYNYIASMPACTGRNRATACFDPLSEYGYGVLDVPHRVIFAPIWQLPFGKDRTVGKTSGRILAGGWTSSAVSTCRAVPDRPQRNATTRCSRCQPSESHRRRLRNQRELRRPSGIG
jgi:hypothetical protein